ncbi:MAG TPA: nitrogen fixation protein FixH [Aquabacterium sp.]|jgi:hypothetical protein|nr:nitrogen fixation protein FixH [Aquabacterium sp.]HRH27207.1 nitrogen fixation protein FixH [Aquabacterium sp.]
MTSTDRQTAPTSEHPKHWWQYPFVWLIVGGPAIVVVAGITTAVIAYRHVDPVLDISKPASNPGEAPAIQGRNRAAQTAVQPAER